MKMHSPDISIEVAIKALSCLQFERIIYISTPVTGGKLVLNSKYRNKDALIAKNICLSDDFSRKIIAITGSPVVNPARLMMKDWSQSTYINFWKRVIQAIASEVWFNNGWEYSNGCVQEYLCAVEGGIQTFNVDGERLLTCDAISLLSNSVARLREKNIPADQIDFVLRELVSINSKKIEY